MQRQVLQTLAIVTALSVLAAAPAMADGTDDNDANRDNDLPHVNIEEENEDGEVELEFVNPTEFTFSFDYRVDGEPEGTDDEWTGTTIAEGPLEGDDFGQRYEVVTLEGEGTETVTLDAEEQVEVRLARGAEQQWYFDWITIEVEGSTEDPDEVPVEEPEEEQAPAQHCRDGGWQELDFRNQGLCIANEVASEASVH